MTTNTDAESPFFQYPSMDHLRADRERWRKAHETLAVDYEKLQYQFSECAAERDLLRASCKWHEAQQAKASNAISDEKTDAARWKKFCGLMAYGDVIVMDAREDGSPLDIDYIHQLTALVDSGSDAKAACGRMNDHHCVHGEPK